MPRLLNCIDNSSPAASCCEKPYEVIQADCVEACLVNLIKQADEPLISSIRKELLFGTKHECVDPFLRLQELHAAKDHILHAFRERVVRNRNGSEDGGMSAIHSEWRMPCLTDRFSRVHREDGVAWPLQGGFHTAANRLNGSAMARLPIPQDIPCDGVIQGCSLLEWAPYPVISLVTAPSTYQVSLAIPPPPEALFAQVQVLLNDEWVNASPMLPIASYPLITIIPFVGFTAVRMRYRAEDGCETMSLNGFIFPPPQGCEITPDFTVDDTVDANDIGSVPDGAYWIVSDGSTGNEWADNLLSIVTVSGPSYTYQSVPVGSIILVQSDSSHWRLTSNGPGPLFIPLNIEYGLGEVILTSAYPLISATGNMGILVYSASGLVIWGGTENMLPIAVPILGSIQEPITARYFFPVGCSTDVPVTVAAPDPILVNIECDEDNLFSYRYTGQNPQQILISAPPGQIIFLSFAQGQMDLDSVLFIHDGQTDQDPFLAAGSYADLSSPPLQVTSSGQYLLLSIAPTIEMPEDLLTWLFQASCVPSLYNAVPIITDDCDTYQFNVSMEVFFGGADPYAFEVYINGSTTPISFGPFSGEDTYDLGDYPIGATVSVIMRNQVDPQDYLWLGEFTTNGDCPNDPCAPVPDFIVRLVDCEFFPDDGSPYTGILFLAAGNQNTCPNGILIDRIYQWDTDSSSWIEQAILVGSVILGDDGTYYVEVSGGIAIPYFQLTMAAPFGSGYWTFWQPAIQQYGLTTNRPIAIQVSLDGIGWTTIWAGNEQELAVQGNVQALASVPFNQLRTVWFYTTCGFIGPVQTLS